MWLKINTDSEQHGHELAAFLRSVKYVKSVEFEDENTPLTEADWIKPGRPATDAEMETLADDMDNEKGGTEATSFFNDLRKKLA